MKTIHTYPTRIASFAFALSCLLAFAFFIACSDELPYEPPQPPPLSGEHNTYIAIKGLSLPIVANTVTTRADVPPATDKPAVRSIRILVFDGTTDVSVVATNDVVFRPIGEDPIPVVAEPGKWVINPTFSLVVPTIASTSETDFKTVWVILNEIDDKIVIEDNGTPKEMFLTDALKKVKTLGEMRKLATESSIYYTGLMQGNLNYTDIEQPTWISANFVETLIPTKNGVEETSLRNPYLVDFTNGNAFERPMAKIVLTNLTNNNAAVPFGENVPFYQNTSLIFIQTIGVRNIPRWYKWQPPSLRTDSETMYNTTNFAGFSTQDYYSSSVTPPTGFFDRNWIDGHEGLMNFELTGGTLFEELTPIVRRLYYTGDDANPFSTNVFELDANMIRWSGANRWEISRMPNYKWYSTLPDSWYANKGTPPFTAPLLPYITPNSGGSVKQFQAAVLKLMEGSSANPLKSKYKGVGSSVEPSRTGGIWELQAKGTTLYLPEHIVNMSASPPMHTELFVTAVRAKMPETGDWIVGHLTKDIFETDYSDIKVRIGSDIKNLNDITEADIAKMWYYTMGTIQLANHLGRQTIVRHYWDIDVFRERQQTNTGTVVVENVRFTANNLDIANPYTAYIPIAEIADPHLYRNTEYRFELVIVEDLPGGTRSSSGWGFSLRKEE